MQKLFFLTLIFLSVFCNRLDKQKIPVETYTNFWAECLLIKQANFQNTQEGKNKIRKLLETYRLDSTKLENFYNYYRKHPTEWVVVESLSLVKMEALSKKQEKINTPKDQKKSR
jgi:hypothetical protein